MLGYREQKISQPDRVSKSGSGRKIGFHKYKLVIPICFIIILSLTASSFPARNPQSMDKFAPGTYTGIFFFSFKHSWNQSSETVILNYYDLKSGNAMGNIKFSVGKNGAIQNVRIKINPFNYDVVSTVEPKTDDSCKGYNASAVGLGWANTNFNASKPPPWNPQPSILQILN